MHYVLTANSEIRILLCALQSQVGECTLESVTVELIPSALRESSFTGKFTLDSRLPSILSADNSDINFTLCDRVWPQSGSQCYGHNRMCLDCLFGEYSCVEFTGEAFNIDCLEWQFNFDKLTLQDLI